MRQHHPTLPASLDPGELDLEQIWYEICEEILDTRFTTRTHNNRKTRQAGCSGPMCRKAAREFSRRRDAAQAQARYAQLDPILDFFFPIAEELIEDAYKDIIKTLARVS